MDSIDLFLEEEKRREKLRDPLLTGAEDAFDEKADGPSFDALPGEDLFEKMESVRENEELEAAVEALREAGKTNPEQEIKIKRLSDQSGYPEEIVKENPEGVEESLKADQMTQTLKESPKLRESAIDLSRFGHDDFDNLSYFEGLYRDFTTGLDRGMMTRELGLLNRKLMGELFRDMTGIGQVTPEEKKEIRKRISEIKKQLPGTRGSGGFIEAGANALGTFIEGLPQVMLAGTVGAGATAAGGSVFGPGGTVAGALTGFGVGATMEVYRQASAIEGGILRDSLVEEGVDEEIANRVGEVGGALAGVLETIGQTKFIAEPFKNAIKKRFFADVKTRVLKDYALKRGLAAKVGTFTKTLGKTVAGETATELGQELVQTGGEEIGKVIDPSTHEAITMDEFGERMGEVFKETLKAMAVLGTPGAVVSVVSEHNKVNQADRNEAFMKELGGNVQESKLAARDEAAYGEFVDKVTEEGDVQNVYINAGKLQEVYQEDTETLVEEIGATDQFKEALELQSDIVIPLSTYTTKIARDVEAHGKVFPHTKFDAEGVTPFEAKTLREEQSKILQEAEKLLAAREGDQEFIESADRVFQNIRQQLIDAKRFNQETADQYATLHQAFAVTKADQLNMKPHEVYEMFGLKIQGQPIVSDEVQTLGQEAFTELQDEGPTEVEKVATGKPTSFNFMRNPESAAEYFGIPEKEDDFYRGYEPSGRYVSITSTENIKQQEEIQAQEDFDAVKFEFGKLVLQNPLVVPNMLGAWKKTLSEKYGGLTGKELSKALIADGYDGVITINTKGEQLVPEDPSDITTVKESYIDEILDLTSFDETKALYQSVQPEEVNPNWYYSTLAEAVHNLPENKTKPKTGKEWLQIIKKLPGVKQEEIVWTGLEEMLLAATEGRMGAIDRRIDAIKKSAIKEYLDMGFQTEKARAAHWENLEKIYGGDEVGPFDPLIPQGEREVFAAAQDSIQQLKAEKENIKKEKAAKLTHQTIMNYLEGHGVNVVDAYGAMSDEDEVWNNPLFQEQLAENHSNLIEDNLDEEIDRVFDMEMDDIGSESWERVNDRMQPYISEAIVEKADEILASGIPEIADMDAAMKAVNHDEIQEEVEDAYYEQVKDEVKEDSRLYLENIARENLSEDDQFRDQAHDMTMDQWERYPPDVGKYEQYTLPGGQNYTELLLTLPEERFVPAETQGRREYTGGHWDAARFDVGVPPDYEYVKEPVNTVAHIRFKERSRWVEGEGLVPGYRIKILAIEEFQSDWGKALRRHLKQAVDFAVGDDISPAEGPFVSDTKSWTTLAVKRMIAYAMENGYDRIEWTSGLQQSKRYNLSTYMEAIRWNPDTRILQIRRQGESNFVEAAQNVEAADLPEYMGEEVAARLLESVPPSKDVLAKWKSAIRQIDSAEAELKRLRVREGEAYFDFEKAHAGVPLSENTKSRISLIGGKYLLESEVLTFPLIAESVAADIEKLAPEIRKGWQERDINLVISEDQLKANIRELAYQIAGINDLKNVNRKIAVEGRDQLKAVEADSPDMSNWDKSLFGTSSGDKMLTGLALKTANKKMAEYYDKMLPNIIKNVLKKLGVKDPGMKTRGETKEEVYTPGEQPGFDMAPLKEALTDREGKTKKIALFQEKRGSFQFGEDITQDESIINLFEKTDLSTFLHETGHFFFEATKHLANQPDAPQQIREDMDTLLGFVGVSDRETWNNMTLEERRAGHEKIARAFEAYLFEGKAPSTNLSSLFRRFSSWLVEVYENLQRLNVVLTDDVRGVFDRMVATDEEIKATKQANDMMPLFDSREDAGMTVDEWNRYQNTVIGEQEEADEMLRAKTLRNMKWLKGARGKVLSQLQREQRERRMGVQTEAAVTVSEQPVYKARQFLRTPIEKKPKPKSDRKVVDPANDSLFKAIAKLGGLDKEEAVRLWGIDPKDKFASGLGAGIPVLRIKDGIDIDAMAEKLADLGYLPVDKNGKWDLRDFEERFFDEHSGNERFSIQNDTYDISEAYENFIATEQGYTPLNFDELQGGKLSAKLLRETYGESEDALWTRLPSNGRYAMVAEEGMDPELVAQALGFSSADKMIQDLVNAPDMREAVEQETDRRMLELYGDLTSQEAKERAINEALHGPLRERMVHAELASLSKRVGQQNVLAVAAREMAKNKINGLPIKDIRPNDYIMAERRANRNAEKALMQGNLEEATTHKRAAVLNYHFSREAIKALEEVDRAVRYFNKFDSAGVRGKIDMDYLDQIDSALEKYDLRKSVTAQERKRRQGIQQWVNSEMAKGSTPVISEELMKDIGLQHYRDVPLEEIRGLRDSIKNIEHLGRLKDRLLGQAKQKKLNEAAGEIAASINKWNKLTGRLKKRHKVLGENLPQDEPGKAKAGFYAEHRKIANIGREADGYQDNGPFWNYITRPMNAAADWEAEMREQATEGLAELFADYSASEFTGTGLVSDAAGAVAGVKPSERLYKRMYIPELGIEMAKMERIMVALNWGNADNRLRVKDGFGWSDEHVEIVLDGLNARDWAFVEKVWKFIHEYWPLIEAKEKRISGVAPEKVKGLPVVTKFGVFNQAAEAGYFPITFTREDKKTHDQILADQTKRAMQGDMSRATTARSHTRARMEAAGKKRIRTDFGVIFEHVNQVIHDLAWHEFLIDHGKLINHEDVVEAMEQRMGIDKFNVITNAVKDVAAGEIEGVKTFERVFNHLRAGVSISAMGWNLGTALLQPIGLTQSMARVGPIWVAKAMLRFFSGAAAMDGSIKEMYEQSSFMRLRAKTMNREINEIRNKITRTGLMSKQFGGVKESYFWLIGKAQMLADAPTWLAAREKALASGYDEETAIGLADQAVIDSQGSGHIKDLAQVQRGGPLLKLWTNFMSYFQTTFNLTMDSLGQTRWTDPVSIGRLGVDFFLLYTAPIVISFMLREALIKGECDGGRDIACVGEKIAREHVSYLFSGMLIAREAVSAIQGFAGYQGPAGARFFSDLARAATQTMQGELDKPAVDAYWDVFGTLFHLPAGQIEKVFKGYMALQSGETDNPAAPFFGYTKR